MRIAVWLSKQTLRVICYTVVHPVLTTYSSVRVIAIFKVFCRHQEAVPVV